MNNKEKLLEILFEEPSKQFHIRLLARLAKINPNTVINISNLLLKEGLISKYKDKDSHLTFIKANTENPYYKLKKQFFNIEKIYKSGLMDYFNEEFSYPTVILFGSYAKAENTRESDIDLFLITEEKKHPNLKIYEQKLNAEIQLFKHTKNEFENLKKSSPELINNIVNGYKLSGFLEVL